MNIIKPSFEILTPLNRDMLKHIEIAGRTCYKSECNITDDSSSKFVQRLNEIKHESVLEHCSVTVKFIHSRSFLAQITRHRLMSFSVESQRFCSYNKDKFDNQITVIQPVWRNQRPYSFNGCYDEWCDSMRDAESCYFRLLNKGLKPQEARGVLPNDTKTEIVMTGNLRNWKHIFRLRTDSHADPEMRRLMIPLEQEFKKVLPEIFGEYE